MNVTFLCRQCQRREVLEVPLTADTFACPDCGRQYALSVVQAEVDDEQPRKLEACAICGCAELFVRKDFSQRWGLTIVVVGSLASSIAWAFHMQYTTYAVLFATALIDVALYCLVGNVLQCYRCRAEYRQLEDLSSHDPFHLETHERYRQQAARLGEATGRNQG
jgi:hypothetical protein